MQLNHNVEFLEGYDDLASRGSGDGAGLKGGASEAIATAKTNVIIGYVTLAAIVLLGVFRAARRDGTAVGPRPHRGTDARTDGRGGLRRDGRRRQDDVRAGVPRAVRRADGAVVPARGHQGARGQAYGYGAVNTHGPSLVMATVCSQ